MCNHNSGAAVSHYLPFFLRNKHFIQIPTTESTNIYKKRETADHKEKLQNRRLTKPPFKYGQSSSQIIIHESISTA